MRGNDIMLPFASVVLVLFPLVQPSVPNPLQHSSGSPYPPLEWFNWRPFTFVHQDSYRRPPPFPFPFHHDTDAGSTTKPVVTPDGPACQPPPNTSRAQYIIGYGSLMQQASKNRTDPNTGPNIPVDIRGFSREWNLRGTSVSASTTFLGILAKSGSSFNGVIYQLNPSANMADTLTKYDKRESFYCRQSVSPSDITMLSNKTGLTVLDQDAQYWIYVNKPENTFYPDEKYPMVESYVDIFITGCMELEENFNLPNFANRCIDSTKGWSTHWVNDRIIPRRPFLYEPKAGAIDKLLAAKLPNVYPSIKIE